MKERLRAIRIQNGLTQKQIAQIINSTNKNVWAYENGIATPPVEILKAYAESFDVSVDYLLGRTDDPDALIVRNYDLKTREQQLIENYRKLPSQTQDYVFGIVQNLALNS